MKNKILTPENISNTKNELVQNISKAGQAMRNGLILGKIVNPKAIMK